MDSSSENAENKERKEKKSINAGGALFHNNLVKYYVLLVFSSPAYTSLDRPPRRQTTRAFPHTGTVIRRLYQFS